ncbi:host cell division inhibitor Icd-like protein [Ewingella americana]|jgi:hypothetical protein|uniref:host cell division inhibitor Icd-like protein n=2 Tax=Ewingella americana TaxID=41202 RepID=UPI003C6D60DF
MLNVAVQNRAFSLAGLLANVSPHSLKEPESEGDSLLSIVMVQTLAKLSMLNLSKPDIDSASMMTNDDAANLTKPDIGKCVTDSIRARLGRGSEGFIAVTTRGRKGFSAVTTRGADEFKDTLNGSFETSTRAEFSDCIKKGFCEPIKKRRCPEFLESIKKGSTTNAALWSCVSAGHSSGASTFALRRSVLSFLPQASSTHEEKLALGLLAFSLSTLDSIPATSSCGKRIAFLSDLLFLFPVAISNTHVQLLSGNTPYTKDSAKKTVDVVAHQNVRWSHTLSTDKAQVVHKIAKPSSALTLTGPLTTNDSQRIEVVMSKHTTPLNGRNAYAQDSERHPVFIWLIAAVRRDCPSIVAVIHHTPAESEQAARRTLAKEHVCFFAGRLNAPRQEVRHA